MGMPTLYSKGVIEKAPWMNDDVNTEKAIDWLIDYFDRKFQSARDGTVKNPGARVTILHSGTGTGKSTVLPPALYNRFTVTHNIRRTIVCSQPTVVSAISIPSQIVEYNKN